MAREILFRGKRLDNGEWVEGTPFYGGNSCKMIFAVALHPDFVDEGNVYYSEGHSVDPSTIGQFTGLTDKNGKRIFEGDLVRYGYSSALGEFWDIGNVVYVPTDGCFEISNLCERYLKRLTQTQIVNSSIEVIGTVYDDKESE